MYGQSGQHRVDRRSQLLPVWVNRYTGLAQKADLEVRFRPKPDLIS
jgi:hypothetical protein